jgi:hypothetical protein
MEELIGITAGEIWKYLSEKGTSTIMEIKSNLGVSNTLLHLALGWLVRENKIELAESGHTYKVSLKSQ